ncbi:unnamed protein product [Parascedosporium putredinis]|uniref:Uncharacterized protein n=1 Tax=Parascedosporium putredinis TaxID=1442378 RepID=A0A9P1MD17_9PEZI|nr:unnamed protein product [Parascedosporium putredinis]CAI7999530.1 unnamed protein product [Parascedosporium putredinis]
MDSTFPAALTEAATPPASAPGSPHAAAQAQGPTDSQQIFVKEAPAVTAQTVGQAGLDSSPPEPVEILTNPLIEGIDVTSLKKGVLIPLKTTLEVRQDHSVVQVYITRAPTKCANEVMK